MPIDSYNERFLPDASVPTTGSRGGSAPPSPGGRATGQPPIQSSDGLANLRANPQTFATTANSTPGGGRSKPVFPGGHDAGDVISYPDGV